MEQLAAFVAKNVQSRIEETNIEETNKELVLLRVFFRKITILPIGSSYAEFPFIIFKSYALGEMRYKMFADEYLLVSNELNILNLLLSH